MHYARAFDWRGMELTRREFTFHNNLELTNALKIRSWPACKLIRVSYAILTKGTAHDAHKRTTDYFIEQTGDTTASIVAFEPDPINAEHCRRIAREHNLNIQLIEAGAYSKDGVLHFNSSGSSMSCIEENGSISVNIRTIDNVVGDQRVSFIKVDIEGSELEALKGASRCIQRDKPICAISAYHRIGDTIVLLNYLKELVPEYCFALRHYSNSSCETVLYAFIKQ